MSRIFIKKQTQKNILFQDYIIEKFSNCLMKSGCKARSSKILYSVFKLLKKQGTLKLKLKKKSSLHLALSTKEITFEKKDFFSLISTSHNFFNTKKNKVKFIEKKVLFLKNYKFIERKVFNKKFSFNDELFPGEDSIDEDFFLIDSNEKKIEPIFFFWIAIFKAAPKLETKRKRLGRRFFPVPIPTTRQRRINLAIRWIVKGAVKRTTSSMNIYEAIFHEIMDTIDYKGFAVQEKNSLHSLASKNRTYIRYRW